MDETQNTQTAEAQQPQVDAAAPAEQNVGSSGLGNINIQPKGMETPEAPPIDGFDYAEVVARAIITDDEKERSNLVQSLRENFDGIPTKEDIKKAFMAEGFTASQTKMIEKLIEQTSGFSAYARDTISRNISIREHAQFENAIKEEYGVQGQAEAKQALNDFCETYNISRETLEKIPTQDILSIIRTMQNAKRTEGAQTFDRFKGGVGSGLNKKHVANLNHIINQLKV